LPYSVTDTRSRRPVRDVHRRLRNVAHSIQCAEVETVVYVFDMHPEHLYLRRGRAYAHRYFACWPSDVQGPRR
jgi:hypothetical protein